MDKTDSTSSEVVNKSGPGGRRTMSDVLLDSVQREQTSRHQSPGNTLSLSETRQMDTRPKEFRDQLPHRLEFSPDPPPLLDSNMEPVWNQREDAHHNVYYRQQQYRKPILAASKYDGTTPLMDYKAHFQACTKINRWTKAEQGLHLAGSLMGSAQQILSSLAPEQRYDYESLMIALERRFQPRNQTELYRSELKNRRRKQDEKLTELGQSIKRMIVLAYPTAEQSLQDVLAKDAFLDSLQDDMDMVWKIQQTRPSNIEEAVHIAVELESFRVSNESKRPKQKYSRSVTDPKQDNDSTIDKSLADQIMTQITQLSEGMKSLQTKIDILEKKKKRTDIICENCKKIGHSSKNCWFKKNDAKRKTHDKTYTLRKRRNGKKERINKFFRVPSEAGLYLLARIENVPTYCLVDTGATMTLVSTDVFKQISEQPCLQKVGYDISLADGKRMMTKGATELTFYIGDMVYKQPVVVADIGSPCILGLDFLDKHRCKIDLTNKEMELSAKTINLQLVGGSKVNRITAAKSIMIPAGHEMIVPGRIHESVKSNLNGQTVRIEQHPNLLKRNGVVSARSLAMVSGQDIPVRIMNVSADPVTIFKQTSIGKLDLVDVSNTQELLGEKFNDFPNHLKTLYESSAKSLSKIQQLKLKDFLIQFQNIFATSDLDLGKTNDVTHKIKTGPANPIKQRARRIPLQQKVEVEEALKKMLEQNVIEESSSPWASPIVLVKKKDGSTRFCVDYRKLNALTEKDAYPLPRIDETLDSLNGVEWFSTLDLASGYWQVSMDEVDKPKTAFTTFQGLYQFKVMPFGLCNAPSTFERLMEKVLSGLQFDICLIYLDDIIIYSRSFDEHLLHLTQVFNRLKTAGLKLKAKKCNLFQKEVNYLGHVVSKDGISTDPSKISAVKKCPPPKDIHELRSFLGMCSYYRRFISQFSKIAAPLHKLTQKNEIFQWNEEHNDAFQTLKTRLTTAPILAYPDPTKPFILDTDASAYGIGGVLSQNIDGQERVVAYASKSLSKAERQYCVTRKELLAVVKMIKHFRPYLYGRSFLIRTDHGALTWLMNFRNPEGQVARWLESLAEYSFEIKHRPGLVHRNADGLSRKPCVQCGRNQNREEQTVIETPMTATANINVLTPDINLLTLQQEDRDLSKLRNWKDSQRKPYYKEISGESPSLKKLWSQWDQIFIKDKLLCREISVSAQKKTQIILPKAAIKETLRLAHDAPTGGHLGVRKTLSRLKDRYYWPGKNADVRDYVAKCLICCRRKGSKQKANLSSFGTGAPLERMAIDIMGKIDPPTLSGNCYILVICDYYTKWTEAFPMPNMETRTIAKILVEEVFLRVGIPYQLHSDQGKQFESRIFTEICQLLGIEKTRTTAYHPQSDGLVERFNRTLQNMLSAFVRTKEDNWDDYLPYVMSAYRSTQQESSKMSPNYLMFGREVMTPLELMFGLPPEATEPLTSYAANIREKFTDVYDHVRENLKQAAVRQKRQYDIRSKNRSFQENDIVWLYTPTVNPDIPKKFQKYWKGPYKIIKKISDITVQLDLGNTTKIVHTDRLKKHQYSLITEEDTEEVIEEDTDEFFDCYDNTFITKSGRESKPPNHLSEYVL